VGHDVGTSGIKTALIDSYGRCLAAEFGPYGSDFNMEGKHEQDPNQWWKVLASNTRRTLRKAHVHGRDVAGISLGVQGLGFIPVDSKGRSLRPCMTWLDSRSKLQARRIVRETGIEVSAKSVVSKFLWLKKNEPNVFRKAQKFVDCGAYLITRMTGSFAWSKWNAKWFGYDERKSEWKFASYGLSADVLPKPILSAEEAGTTSAPVGRQMGVRAGIPVIAGGSDTVAAYVGSGAVKPGSAHISLGSSSWICLALSRELKTRSPMDLITGKPFENWINVGESESACFCFDWYASQLHERVAKMDELARSSPAGSRNLIFVPWMKGERSPINDECARASVIGLTLNHDRADIARSIMEGVAFNDRIILEQLIKDARGLRVNSLRAVGGGFKSKIWTQIFADVVKREIDVIQNPQYAGAIGAGLIAALGVGVYKSVNELQNLVPTSLTARPTMRTKTYDTLFSNFKQCYPREIAKIYERWGPT